MQEVGLDEGIQMALDALHSDRLALLCGAGLSMASPSNLPSAFDLAAEAKRRYDATYGDTRLPLATKIEDQADFFFKRGELDTIYLRTYIAPDVFAGIPNAGHSAVADLLLVRGIDTAVSTNVDTMIETAGMHLFGKISAGIEMREVASVSRNRSPLLKIHGCWSRDQPNNTIWTLGQLSSDPIRSRIIKNKEWLSMRLLDRDLIIVGYWTDWEYLNSMLEQTLGDVRPARVIVVDPSDGALLAIKAPVLHGIGQRIVSNFFHVRQSGSDFLETLRIEFSKNFVRRILCSGVAAYEQRTGKSVDPAWKNPASLTAQEFWQVRRDLEGRLPREPARERELPEEPLLGQTILELCAKGATADGSYWLLDDGRRIRIIRTQNKVLHQVQADFLREMPPLVSPDIIIAVGAENQNLPMDIVRDGTNPTIARGSSGRWLTRLDAIEELGL